MPIKQNESPGSSFKPGRGETRLLQFPGIEVSPCPTRQLLMLSNSDIVSRLARFFPEATPVRIPIKLSHVTAMATPTTAAQRAPRRFRFYPRHRHRVRHAARSLVCGQSSSGICRSRPRRKQRRLAARRSLRGRGSISPGTDSGCRPLPQTCSQLDCEIMTASTQPSVPPSYEDQGITL